MRYFKGKLFRFVFIVATFITVLSLLVLLVVILEQGLSWLDLEFLGNFPSRFPSQAGIKSSIWGSLWLIFFTILFSVPIGMGAAVYLEEYSKRGRLNDLIEVNISNLAGIPSIVFGILGLVFFVRALSLGRSILAGALTMSLVILPVIVVSTREALRAVPKSIRDASYAVGATQWQTTFYHVLPTALPGILTGVILAVSRAMGETAPLIMIGALTYVAFVPENPLDSFTTLPIQIFNWASRPQKDFHDLAAAGIIVLLLVLLSLNAIAIYVRYRSQRKLRW